MRNTCWNLIALALLATAANGQTLGSIDFPSSGMPAAQPAFIKGVLLLHSFEYDDAAAAFREAQRIDPAFAMAYWGEALTYTHAVWNEQNAAAARAALARLAPTPTARAAKAPTARERGYLDAVEILYGEGSKPHRDTVYSAAMERLVQEYPDDDEAKAFLAVSLLGLNQGTRDVWTYMRAAAIAEDVFSRHPHHPGAAHYIIHSFDDPTHAPLGLKAARAYASIAPDAAHAQHMTSHIFVAMGMWDDLVTANEQAMHVTERQLGRSPVGCRHYNEWLEYGYLQQGRLRDAMRLVQECADDAARMRGAAGSLDRMRAIYLIDARDWDGPVARIATDTAGVPDWARTGRDFADGLGALQLGDIARARVLEQRIAKRRLGSGGYVPRNGEVLAGMLRGAIALAEKRGPDALRELEGAAALEDSLPFEFGPPWTYKPPRELMGEALLAMNRPAEAAVAFDRALRRTPLRAAALLGLARARAASRDFDQALAAYQQLQAVWHRAQPGFADLAEVNAYLARHVSERH